MGECWGIGVSELDDRWHTRRMERLVASARKDERTIVGLNSGTSMDGIDACVVRIRGGGRRATIQLLAHVARPFTAQLREHLLKAPDITAIDVCRLHRSLGEEFASVALDAIEAAGMVPTDVDLIGSHGQTLVHLPSEAGETSTLQGADADIISARLGVPVIADFRAADVAAGGAGAPLMPWLDMVLLGDIPRTLSLNLGGILAFCWLPGGREGVVASDAGPCNVPLDLLAQRATSGRQRCDVDGKLAASGRVVPEILRWLESNTWFAQSFPKTTGREHFGVAHVDQLLAKFPDTRVGDLIATHVALTASALRQAVDSVIGPPDTISRVVASGGGFHNPVLVGALSSALGGQTILTSERFGIPADAKEAVLFALLANDRILGIPAGLPAVTGASHPALLGKIAGG